jgi:hypothetical protein
MNVPNLDPLKVINNIRANNLDFYNTPRGIGALRDLQQTFPNPWLYIAELLQNAVDEKAAFITVASQEDGSLLFEHSGTPFSSANVESLCMRGVSSKGAATVGFMGIGFKSVFRSFERAEVSSGPWRFALTVENRKGDRFGDNQRNWLGAVLPEWDNEGQPPTEGMTCRFRLCRRLPDLPPITNDLEHVLGDREDLLALLAWQGVEQLTWGERVWDLNSDDYPLADGSGTRVQLSATDSKTGVKKTWVLFSRDYQPSDKAIARFLEHRQLSPSADEQSQVYEQASRSRRVAIFCETGNAGIPCPVEQGSAFALLPTGVTFPLGMHVQADWLLVVSRRELMQIEGNEWHEEILDQIPILLNKFLTWLVDTPWPTDSEWYFGYNALPAQSKSERETNTWFGGEKFRKGLADCLRDLPFLPVPSKPREPVTFISPKLGRKLPKPLANLFKDDAPSHRLLFGERTFSSALLGERALKCMNSLELLDELSAEELQELWENRAIAEWFAQLEEERRNESLARLLESLSSLDNDDTWLNAQLPCLPSESEGWICRDDAKRFPADWAVLTNEKSIRSALQVFLGDESKIVRWTFDRYLQQTRNPGARYLAPIDPVKLETLANEWWDSLSTKSTPSEVELALGFTVWVRAKQSQRKNLIRKLLAIVDDQAALLPTSEVVVAGPYADDCRRFWFPELPVVASDYLSADSSASPNDWRSFFESLTSAPVGKFDLDLFASSHSGDELKSLMGASYTPPWLRVTYLALNWQGLLLTSNEYGVLDARLPKPLAQRLERGDPIICNESSAIALWISESPAMLTDYSQCRLAYIPYNSGIYNEVKLARDATWKKQLRDIPWIFTSRGAGPFRPGDVLSQEDSARPEAPVAGLPPNLVNVLIEAGIEFGSQIPYAPAMMRLRAYGPTASVTELVSLLEHAIEEAHENEQKTELLKSTLSQINVFPLPDGRESLDHLSRVPLERVVRSERGRSNFNSWLSTIESFGMGSTERNVFELVDSVFPFPTDTTARQALGFLSWVWTAKPEADRVRNLLPRAYQYVLEDLDHNLEGELEASQSTIMVFTQNIRQWTSVSDENLFFNDFAEAKLPGSIKVLLATPGHLGDNRNDQIAVAELLGLKRLSERFSIETFPSDPYGVPDLWQQAFTKIQRELLSRVSAMDNDDVAKENIEDQLLFFLSRCDDIYTIVLDDGAELERYQRLAALEDEVIYVTGDPADFAEPVCQILFNQWGFRLRRDLVDLIPKVAIQLSRIDNERFWFQPTRSEKEQELELAEEKLNESKAEDLDVENDMNEPARVEPTSVPPKSSIPDDVPLSSLPAKPTSETPPPEPETARGHTASDREGMIRALMQKRKEIERQLRDVTSIGVVPLELGTGEEPSKRVFQSDQRFREAVMDYERMRGRFPQSKIGSQAGHDIDSFDSEEGNLNRKLKRRIEVKGKGVPWHSDEIVEQSDRQYRDAWQCAIEPGISLADDCDYWLYVVEDDGTGKLNVLPIRNPAKRAAHYEFRAGTWRHIAEVESSD